MHPASGGTPYSASMEPHTPSAVPIKTQREGMILCFVAAAGFSTTGIFAKLAYSAHVRVSTLLSARFLIAAIIMWLVVVVAKQRLPPRRNLVAGFLLGLFGYVPQVTLLFLSLKRIDAALSSLLFYSYPALVTVGALLIGRESLTRRRGIALVIALTGVLLVFAGATGARGDGIGVLLSLASALGYAVIILFADTLTEETSPTVLSALATAGAGIAFLIGGFVLGDLHSVPAPSGWVPIAGLTLLATVFPLIAFYGGISRVGPSTASILSTVEPAMTVIIAAIVLQERLGIQQFLGGALVVTAVLILQVRWQGRLSAAQRM